MKSLQETLNENLVKGTSRLRLGNDELFDSDTVARADIKKVLREVDRLRDLLKDIDKRVDQAFKNGIVSASLSDPDRLKPCLKVGDRMRATMYGKEYDCTVIDVAWNESRDCPVPIGKSDDKAFSVIIPDLKTRWYKID